MSFPQHIDRLNELGRQLSALHERARTCGDSIYGPRPETKISSSPPISPPGGVLDAQLQNVCAQFDIVIENLRSEISRIEDAILDGPAKSTTGY